MNIEKLLIVISGKRQDKNPIEDVNSASIYPQNIEQDDLFFASSSEDIALAISNGAAAIVVEDTELITDAPVAWIKVSSLKISAFLLIRYINTKKGVAIYLVNELEHTLIKMVMTKKEIAFLPETWEQAFEQIINTELGVLVTRSEEIMKLLSDDNLALTKEVYGYNVADSLFFSTVNINKYVYQELEMPPFYLDTLLRVVYVFDHSNLKYDLHRISYTKHFKPYFPEEELLDFDPKRGDQVVIMCDNPEAIYESKKYIVKKAEWIVKSIIFAPKKKSMQKADYPIRYETHKDLIPKMHETHFNYAFIYSDDKELLSIIGQSYRDKVIFK